ncbi:MAG: family protein phosphatase, partial [Solirubrobacteraceae bacterium]|nr:family protein phosphatase [Solirubrobacteraceae bacterium]
MYLLCSDGLTSMIHEAEVEEVLRGADGLQAAGRGLIDAANRAGGRDNITVVLLRLEEVGGPGDDATVEDPDTKQFLTPPAAGGATALQARAPAEPMARRRAPRAPRANEAERMARRARRRRRRTIALVLTVLVIVPV